MRCGSSFFPGPQRQEATGYMLAGRGQLNSWALVFPVVYATTESVLDIPYWRVFVNLTETLIYLGEAMSTRELLPSDWPISKSLGHFLSLFFMVLYPIDDSFTWKQFLIVEYVVLLLLLLYYYLAFILCCLRILYLSTLHYFHPYSLASISSLKSLISSQVYDLFFNYCQVYITHTHT